VEQQSGKRVRRRDNRDDILNFFDLVKQHKHHDDDNPDKHIIHYHDADEHNDEHDDE
jgi:hypothetical protein